MLFRRGSDQIIALTVFPNPSALRWSDDRMGIAWTIEAS